MRLGRELLLVLLVQVGLFQVAVFPGYGLRTGNNPGNIRILAAGPGGSNDAPALRFQPASCLLLRFFLARSLARPLVLGWS